MANKRVPYSAYLYTDGTLVQPYEEKRGAKKVGETVDITRGYCVVELHSRHDAFGLYRETANRIKDGRIVLTLWCNTGFVGLAADGVVRATMPDLMAGTQATRARNIPVQTVRLVTKDGYELTWTEMPALCSPVFTVEDAVMVGRDIKPGDMWDGMKVVTVTNRKGARRGKR